MPTQYKKKMNAHNIKWVSSVIIIERRNGIVFDVSMAGCLLDRVLADPSTHWLPSFLTIVIIP
jgi:hypothetical protein